MRLLQALAAYFVPHRSGTVRYAFPAVAFAGLVAGLTAALIGSSSSYIKITTVPVNVTAGQEFTVTVSAVVSEPVNAVDIAVKFPTAQTKVLGIDTGQSVITLWTQDPYVKDGIVHLRGGTFRRGFIGEHVIAKIRAEAIETGLANVTTESAQAIAGDGTGNEVPLDNSPLNETRIYIQPQNGNATGSASVHIITDINGNGTVDLSDISAFMAAWFTHSTTFDFNGDGKMTFSDFSILLSDFFFK